MSGRWALIVLKLSTCILKENFWLYFHDRKFGAQIWFHIDVMLFIKLGNFLIGSRGESKKVLLNSIRA